MADNSPVTPTSRAQVRADAIVRQLVAAGIKIAATLPDSWLTEVINSLDREPAITHVRVAREDDGAAICAGAALAGSRGVLVCQNAGLLVSVNGLAAYALHHQLPFLTIAAARGGPDDGFYYQAYKGQVTEPVLRAIGLPHQWLRDARDDHLIAESANQAWLHRRPTVVLCGRRALLGEAPA